MWRAILAALVIFGAGVMTGGLLVWRTSRSTPALPRPVPLNASPLQTQLRSFVRRIEVDLTLTPEQRRRIEGILTERQKRAKDLWEPVAEQMRDELKEAREEIRGVLTPHQRKKFEELVKQRPPASRRSVVRPPSAVPARNGDPSRLPTFPPV